MLNKRAIILIGIGALLLVISVLVLIFSYGVTLLCIAKEVLLAIVTGVVFATPSALLLLANYNVTGKRKKRQILSSLQEEITDISQLSDNATQEEIHLKTLTIQDCSMKLNHIQNDNFLCPKTNKKICDLRNDLFSLNKQLTQFIISKNKNGEHIQEALSEIIQKINSSVTDLLGIKENPDTAAEETDVEEDSEKNINKANV